MNILLPVAKEAYKKHILQIEKATKSNAEAEMKDAAKGLWEKILTDTRMILKWMAERWLQMFL